MANPGSSRFKGKNVILLLADGPLDCRVLDVVMEYGVLFYECELDSGDLYYANLDDVSGVTVKTSSRQLQSCSPPKSQTD